VHAAADAAVLPLRVLAHADDVDVRGGAAGQRRDDARKQPHGPKVHVLHEPAAKRQQQLAGGDVVRDLRIADGAKVDRVERHQLIGRVGVHHPAVAHVEVAAPRERRELQREASARGRRLQDIDACRDDFLADAVAGEHCNAMRLHRRI
jgi:hypothetical protein